MHLPFRSWWTAALLAVVVMVVGAMWWGKSYPPDAPRMTASLGSDALCDPRYCGNKQLDPGEQCDDGNNLDGDGCDPLCRLTCNNDADCPSGECAGGICKDLCGNGIVDPPICVSSGGGLDCPPSNPNDLRIVYLPGDVFATGHASGDLNKDGSIDIVVAYYMGNGTQNAQGSYNGILEAYINQGNGTFAPKKFVANFQWNDGGGQRGLDVVDVDNDGDGDVVVYDGAVQGIEVYRNDNLTFTKTHTIPDYFAFYLSHGDINKDGDPELGLVGFKPKVGGTYENSVFKAGPATTFVSPPTLLNYSTGYDTMRFADMDNDGDQDLVVSTEMTVNGSFGYRLSTFLSNGNGTFADPVTMLDRNANPNVLSMSIGDANGDGKQDVALGENGGTIIVVLGNGRGGSLNNAVINVPVHPRFVAFADPSGDGKLDIAFMPGLGTEGKNIWFMKGSGDGISYAAPERLVTVSPPPSGRPPFTWSDSYYDNYDLRSADYDGDGRLDLSVTHALSSDGASVILFRSSIDGCTKTPPVVTCSQPEECDDGSQNGQPGKCTRQCTLCGNGVIDTVNNVPEQCDDGAQNGQQGSTCSLRCTRIQNDRLGCVGIGKCALVPSTSNAPACQNASHCPCDPADPTCNPTHAGCVNNACVPTTDPLAPFCTGNADCAPCPASTPNCHSQCNVQVPACVAVPTPGAACPNGNGDCGHLTCNAGQCIVAQGPGTNECDALRACPKLCNDNRICEQGETCTCFDCASDPVCASCDNDTVCEAGESCRCGDCSTKPVCAPRLGCTGVGQCTLVSPGSTAPDCRDAADCCNPADPLCRHLKCENQQCTQFPGPGINNCAQNTDDCAPCPASTPNCHSQCNVVALACMAVATPGEECPSGNGDCGHLACLNAQCVVVPGKGVNECATPLDCVDHCGNGLTEPQFGEQCDDGNNIPNDACTNNCRLYCVDDSTCPCDEQTHECTGMCGDRRVDIGEACDEGPNNRTQPPERLNDWYCKAFSCTISSCFDSGDNDHDQFTDDLDPGCWSYNLSAVRPNRGGFLGFLLAQNTIFTPVEPEEFLPGKDDEACPLAMVDMGAFCAMTCNPGDICPNGDTCPENGICPPVCGNGIIDVDLGEQCDDGNLENNDACTNQCRLPPCVGSNCPRCGDGVYQPELGEQCDGSDPPASLLRGCSENCRLKCTNDDQCPGTCDEEAGLCIPPQCGDGEVNQPWERCDDGDINNENKCNNACQPTCNEDPDCESGRCDKAREVCFSTCGNLHLDAGEACDDGNLIDNDACTNACQFHCVDDSACDCDEEIQQCRPMCGNGRIDQGEGCDDGNRVDRDECSNRCQVRCRPGTICPDSQACPQNGLCFLPGFCGDGIVDGVGEQCDDGNSIDTDACSNECRARCSQNLECPNGLLCVGEECAECANSLQCDAGFCVDGHCRQALPICGNGTVESGEACDDGNADDADGCTATCSFPIGHACASSAQCQTRLCQNSACVSCQSAGQCGSGVRCSEGNCLFGGVQCGDGTQQAGEACDDGNLVEQDECTSACLRPFGEACAHASECASTICSGGSCTPCRTDTECSTGTRCAVGMCLTNAQMAFVPNICGNGMLEADEECDDGNNTFGDGCTPGCFEGNAPRRIEVASDMTISMPFGVGDAGGGRGVGGAYGSGDQRLHPGAGDNLSDTGPATVAVMAAGAAAGAAWVRRRLGKKR